VPSSSGSAGRVDERPRALLVRAEARGALHRAREHAGGARHALAEACFARAGADDIGRRAAAREAAGELEREQDIAQLGALVGLGELIAALALQVLEVELSRVDLAGDGHHPPGGRGAHEVEQLLRQFREGMIVPRRDEIAASLERGKESGEVRADLDTSLATNALMGSFLYHSLAVGSPPKGWSEQVVDTLWPGFAA
jgi:hypothetical protein